MTLRPTATLRSSLRLLPVATLAFALFASGCKTAPHDASLGKSVQDRIAADNALANQPIQAAVQNGVATLTGAVTSEAARTLAANDAAQIADVRTVVNNLVVTTQQAVAPVAPLPPPEPVVPPPPAPKPAPVPSKAKVNTSKPPAPSKQQLAQNTPPPPPTAPIERPTPTAPPPPPPPAFRNLTLDSGSNLPVRITQTLDSATTQQGDSFTGVIATDIIVDGLVAIPQGTAVTGRVSEVHEAAHYKGSSLLTIELTNLNRNGERIPITTQVYSKEGEGRGKNTAAKVGGGAAVGAILGGIIGGGKGAAIGAAAGGGAGAGANTITRGQQVQIPSETLIRFTLTNAVALRVSTKAIAGGSGPPPPDTGDNPQRRPLDTPPNP